MQLSTALAGRITALLGTAAAVGIAPAGAMGGVTPDWLGWLDLASYVVAAGFGALLLYLLSIARRLQRKVGIGRAQRAQTEDQLAHHRRRLGAIFDNAIVGIALSRPDGSYTEVNAHFARMLGYGEDELCAHSNLDITFPDDIPLSRERLAALIDGRIASYTIDKRFVRKDGSHFWASISAAPIHDKEGKIESVICVVLDVDERKLAEERLQRILFELPIATLVVDTARRITHRSEKFESLFGYTSTDVAALHDWLPLAYPDPAYREEAIRSGSALVETSRATGHASGPIELRVRCKNGAEKAIEFHYVDLPDQGIWMMNDATEQHEMEESMRAINEHLMERLSEINTLQEQLRRQAMHDSLTGLFNRRYLDEMLDRELARAKREGPPLTVMMLDIDHFKKLNDTYGHQAGDEVLRALAEMLLKNSRAEDIPCRYGGEEFLLVLPNMGRHDAIARAEQWRREFEAMRIVFANVTMNSTVSIGIATFPEHGSNHQTLIESADKALYAAKHNGRNRVEIRAH